MRLRIVTHVERDLRAKLPSVWPEFMHHDPALSGFWPRLYEVYPDFQLWVLDGNRPVGHACTVPVAWDGVPQACGVDWAVSDGTAGTPTTLCAVVVGVEPAYRGRGIGGVVLARTRNLAAAHGLDCLIAPVRPTWKERYPLTPIERYVEWRREDGLPYDPWLRTHERLGAEVLAPAPRSLTIGGTREEWEGWTGLQFPEDGDYVVPGALVPVRFEHGRGTYVEPNVWMRHPLG
jgi:GNAT superfamily N-acetyltransferase